MFRKDIKILDVTPSATGFTQTYLKGNPKYINSLEDNRPKTIVQETYEVQDGLLRLIESRMGTYYPPFYHSPMESIEWN